MFLFFYLHIQTLWNGDQIFVISSLSLECSETETKAKAEYDKVKENQATFNEKLESVKEAKKEKMKQFNKIQK